VSARPLVLVAGGGAIGMAIALHLHWRGAAVQVVERGALGGGVSRLGGGWVAAQGRRNPAQLAFALDSIASYPEFLGRAGVSCGFRQSGSLLLLETETQVAERRAVLAEQMTLPGYDGFVFLSPAELRALEPIIRSPHILCGTWREGDCTLDPPALASGLAAAVRREGITVAEGAAIEAIARDGAGWRVATTIGDFAADVVVNAAGAGAVEIAKLAGFELNLSPVSGQIMTTAPQPSMLRTLVVAAHNAALPDCPLRDLRQGADGRLWIGTVNHHGSPDAAVRRADTDRIRAAMTRLFPELDGIPFEAGHAGTRSTAADGLSVYGRMGDTPFHVAVPLSGIAEAAAAGRRMAEHVLEGASPLIGPAFAPGRPGVAGPLH
jgi:sarcosine oxidase, subunit beta